MELRLGELLVENGVLTTAEVRQVLEAQNRTHEPFGVIAERLFSIEPMEVEHAWVRQYVSLTRTIDPTIEVFEDDALRLVTRRQAWQFRVMPIRFDGDELMTATTPLHLRRALRFANNVIGVPVYFVMTTPEALGEALCERYTMPGMTPRSVVDDGMDRLLSSAYDASD